MRHFLRVHKSLGNHQKFTQGKVYKETGKASDADHAGVKNDRGFMSEINLVAEGYWLEIPETFNLDTAASLISEWAANLDLSPVSFYEFAKSRFDDHVEFLSKCVQREADELKKRLNKVIGHTADALCMPYARLAAELDPGRYRRPNWLPLDPLFGRFFNPFFDTNLGEPFSLAQKRPTTFISNQPEKEKPKMIQIEDVHTVTINGTDASTIDDQGILHFVMLEEQNLVALNAIKTPSVAIDNLRKKHKANINRLLLILDERHIEQLKKDNPGCGVTLITIGGDNMAESVAKILAATREDKDQPAGSAAKSETEEPEDTTG
jgi:hypothetical protein